MAQPSHGLAMGRETDIVRHTPLVVLLCLVTSLKRKA
jgi:hypothetical protein